LTAEGRDLINVCQLDRPNLTEFLKNDHLDVAGQHADIHVEVRG